MTDAPVRHRTSTDVVSWRRDGFVAPRQPLEGIDELLAFGQPVDTGGIDGRNPSWIDGSGRPRPAGKANRLVASLVDSVRRLTDEPAEVLVARVIDAGPGAVGLTARQLVHEEPGSELLASCAILVSREPSTCVVEIAPARHHDVLVTNDDGLLPRSAERALTWRSLELPVDTPVWIHPLAPCRVLPDALGATAALVLVHFTRVVAPVRRDVVVTKSFVAPSPITSLTPTSASVVADAIVQLYDTRGGAPYVDGVDHGAHALQAGANAMAAGAPVSMIVAAFLHDVGLLVGGDQQAGAWSATRESDRDAPVDHGVLGAELLERWFAVDVTRPIRLHVAAQRYLAATAADLDHPPSLVGVAHQSGPAFVGGPMSPAEMVAFEATAGWLDAVRLRRWDAAAVEPGAPTPSLDTFRTLIESVAVVEGPQR